MRSGIRDDARTAKLVTAIGLGINTSRLLAGAFGSSVANISPELHRLCEMGVISRGRHLPTTRGRPCIAWRLSVSVQ